MENNYCFKQRVQTLQAQQGIKGRLVVEVLPGVCTSRDLKSPGSKMDLYFDAAQLEQVQGQSITTYYSEEDLKFSLDGELASIMLNGLEGKFIGFVDGTKMAPGLTGIAQATAHAKKLLVQK